MATTNDLKTQNVVLGEAVQFAQIILGNPTAYTDAQIATVAATLSTTSTTITSLTQTLRNDPVILARAARAAALAALETAVGQAQDLGKATGKAIDQLRAQGVR